MTSSVGTKYTSTNGAKAAFDDIYQAPTPHAYLSQMRRLGYQIGEQARPYCVAAAELLAAKSTASPVQMVDVGCSYGVGSAFVKFGSSFEELVSFYESRAPSSFPECVAATRAWLDVVPPSIDMQVVGLDTSSNAIRFASAVGLLDAGISRNLECDDMSVEEQALIEGCNLLISTGAIGYVGRATFRRLLAHLGRSHPNQSGPAAVMTVLRMFDPIEVAEEFEAVGYEFKRVPNVQLPQRGFSDARERREIVSKVRDRGLNTVGLEELGVLYADLYIASPKKLQPRLMAAMEAVSPPEPVFRRQVEIAKIGISSRVGEPSSVSAP